MYFKHTNLFRMFAYDPYMAWSFYVTSAIQVLHVKAFHKKLRRKHYAGKTVYTQDAGNEILKAAIENGQPFMFGRNGSNELSVVGGWLFYSNGISKRLKITEYGTAFLQSGLFPLEIDTAMKFTEILLNANKRIDLYGTFRMILEDYYIKRYMPADIQLTHLNMMDFWRYREPFTCKLKGKKVLVVHPLADMITEQYKHRKELYPNPEFQALPEFELITFQAVQTIGLERDPRFDTWFDALDYMKKEISKLDFEVALLGCGAYGMPLAAHIKDAGKVSIYMGGVLQMLFGIKGKRWDMIPEAAALYNDYWKYPEVKYIPMQAEKVEGSCYW